MRFTHDYSRMSAFSWDEAEDDGLSRDPELEEEFMSRDWQEASKPLRGGRLKWEVPNGWMVKQHWSPAGGGRESGPRWNARATDKATYQVWAQRTLNENLGGDYYTYEFNPVCIWMIRMKKGKKTENRKEVLGGEFETLAEAQKVCEDHFLENFGD